MRLPRPETFLFGGGLAAAVAAICTAAGKRPSVQLEGWQLMTAALGVGCAILMHRLRIICGLADELNERAEALLSRQRAIAQIRGEAPHN